MGQRNFMQNIYTPKYLPGIVPQLVYWSFTIFLGTYHPKNRQVKNPPNGNNI